MAKRGSAFFFCIVTFLCAGAIPAAVAMPRVQKAPAPQEVRLSPAERKKFNRFFCNFSESYVPPFSRKPGPKNEDLIRFGVFHNWINRLDMWKKTGDGSFSRIPARYIEESIDKFFGIKKVRHQTIDESITYRDGYYYFPNADGEAITFSQMNRLRKGTRKDEFVAEVQVFRGPNGWIGDPQAAPSTWKDSGGGVPEVTERRTATLRKVTEKGVTRYILVEYL
jgi:hypothetical protein